MPIFVKLPIHGLAIILQRYFSFEIVANLIANNEGIDLWVVLLYWACVFKEFCVKIMIL